MEENTKREGKVKELNDYLDFLKYQKNYSDYTIQSYESDILEYLDFIHSEGILFKEIEYSDIRFFLMYLKDNKKDDNSSIDRKLSALRGFSLSPSGAGILFTTASRTSSIPIPILAEILGASCASMPITSSISLITRSGSADGRSILLITGKTSRS